MVIKFINLTLSAPEFFLILVKLVFFLFFLLTAVDSGKESAKKDTMLYLPILSVLAIPLVVLLVWRSKLRRKILESGECDA